MLDQSELKLNSQGILNRKKDLKISKKKLEFQKIMTISATLWKLGFFRAIIKTYLDPEENFFMTKKKWVRIFETSFKIVIIQMSSIFFKKLLLLL